MKQLAARLTRVETHTAGTQTPVVAAAWQPTEAYCLGVLHHLEEAGGPEVVAAVLAALGPAPAARDECRPGGQTPPEYP
jgi:hypothetical protein